MITALADAWRWYDSVRKLTLAMRQLGKRHWSSLPWEGELGRDNRLRGLEGPKIVDRSEDVLGDLDDIHGAEPIDRPGRAPARRGAADSDETPS